MALLALIVLGTAGLFGFLILRQSRALIRALKALRDKIDGTSHWP